MRGSPPPHPSRLTSPSTTKGSCCPAIELNTGTYGLTTRSCRFEVPIWRNAQCESLRRRVLCSSHRHARKNYHSPRSACQNRESRTSTLRNVYFGESRSANDDAPARSRSTCFATHERTTTLHGERVKTGNRPRLHPKYSFWRKVSQRTTTLLHQIPVVSAKPEGPHRTATSAHQEARNSGPLAVVRRSAVPD